MGSKEENGNTQMPDGSRSETISQASLTRGRHNYRSFNILLTCAQISGGLLVVLVLFWTTYFRAGFSWHADRHLQFNWHYLLTIIGMVYLLGNGLITYRTFRHWKRPNLKINHALILFVALIVSAGGMFAAYDSRNLAVPPKPHINTVHSLFGFIAFVGFALQWIVSVIIFFVPRLAGIRHLMFPFHSYFGLALFITACTSAVLGFGKTNLGSKQQILFITESVLVKSISLIVFLFAFIVAYLVIYNPYKRLRRP